MARKRDVRENEDIMDADFPVRFDRRPMIERFRSAIRDAGGVRSVAARSGVPKGTIDNLLGGTEIRFSAAYAIANACNVSLDWLATGRGDNADRSQPPSDAIHIAEAPPSEPLPVKPASLFSTLDMDQFALCLELIQTAFTRMNQPSDPRRMAQLAALLYDAMRDGTFATSGLDELFARTKK